MKPQFTLAAALAVATIVFSTAMPAAAQNFVWGSNADNDPSNQGAYTARLWQSVPETDNVAFSASCSPRGQLAVISYNTGSLPNGRQVVVDFFQNGQNVYSKSGTVYHGDGEEGIAGVAFDTRVNDGLWVALSRGNHIRYQVQRMGMASMHLRGSTRAINRFRRDCGAIINASSGGGGTFNDDDNEENNVASGASCRDFGRVRSRNANRPISIRFVNRSGSHRSVMWLDYKGQPKHYKDLANGESYFQQTYVGHPWMFTDGPGNCKEIFVPVAGAGNEFAITYDR